MTAIGALGLGRLLGFIIIWIDSKLRKHYNPKYEPTELGHVSSLFFDKEYIRNLKA